MHPIRHHHRVLWQVKVVGLSIRIVLVKAANYQRTVYAIGLLMTRVRVVEVRAFVGGVEAVAE